MFWCLNAENQKTKIPLQRDAQSLLLDQKQSTVAKWFTRKGGILTVTQPYILYVCVCVDRHREDNTLFNQHMDVNSEDRLFMT